jgi:polar amino acid transport system substrate-binding protein
MSVKHYRNWLQALMAVLLLSLLAVGCGTADQTAGKEAAQEPGKGAGTQQEVVPEKKYVVAMEVTFPPFEMMDGNKVTGFDVDVITAIAEAAGFQIEIMPTGWDPLFDGIEKGSIDAGIDAITITEERKKKFDFSDPYFEATQLIMVPEDSPASGLADLKGKQIAVQSATTGEVVLQKAFGKTYEGLRGYDDFLGAIDDFFNGRVDAVIADNGFLQYFLPKMKEKKYKLLRDDSFDKEYYGIMVRKGNTEFLGKINQGLKTIKENGKLQEIYGKYFQQKPE